MGLRNDKLIQVCDSCLMATCWHGIFLCDESAGAGITEKTVGELKKLNLEHPSYWTEKHLEPIFGKAIEKERGLGDV